MKYLLDSVIVIDHFNGIELATNFLAERGSECALSVITRAEVLAGFGIKTEPLARELLDVFITLPVTSDIADIAAGLRRTECWKLPNAIQAAVAIQHGLILVTRNTKDFQPGANPDVFIPYRL